MKEPLNPHKCVICWERSTTIDLDIGWCDEHLYRHQFLMWGHKHNYMALNCGNYAIAEGAYFWVTMATLARDEAIWTFLAYIEWVEDEWQKEQIA